MLFVGFGAYWFIIYEDETVPRDFSDLKSQSELAKTSRESKVLKVSQKNLKEIGSDFSYKVNFTAPYILISGDEEQQNKINRLLDEKIQQVIDEFKQSVVRISTSTQKNSFQSVLSGDYTITASNNKLLSFELNFSEDRIDLPKGNNFVYGFTYDLIHDKQIQKLEELFRNDVDFVAVVSRFVPENFKSIEQIKDFKNFVLTVHGLRMIFNPALGVLDIQRVNIMTEDIKDFLPQDSVLFLFK